jgi:hypothetical protein
MDRDWSAVTQGAGYERIARGEMIMSQLLHRQRGDEALGVNEGAAAVGRIRPGVVVPIVALGLLVGVAGGLVASYWTGGAGRGVEEIQRLRAEEMADYHERQWLAHTRPQQIARLRAEEMADYHERQWLAHTRPQQIARLRAEEMADYHERQWRAGQGNQ